MSDDLLQASDLVYVRAQAEKAMPDLVTIQQYESVSDGQGGQTQKFINAFVGVRARISERSGASQDIDRMLAGRESVVGDWILTTPWDITIRVQDRVVHGDQTYDVVFVGDDRSHDTARRSMMKRVD